MFNGTMKTFEMISRAPSTNVIATVGNKIVVLMQEQPTKPMFPSLPGGKIEDKETPLQAAKRELVEETGYESNKWELLEEWFGASKIHYPETLFIARDCKKHQEKNWTPEKK